MASQPALDLAQPIFCRIGKRTPRPEIVAEAARILALARRAAPTVDVYAHCAQIAATIPHPALQTEAGQ